MQRKLEGLRHGRNIALSTESLIASLFFFFCLGRTSISCRYFLELWTVTICIRMSQTTIGIFQCVGVQVICQSLLGMLPELQKIVIFSIDFYQFNHNLFDWMNFFFVSIICTYTVLPKCGRHLQSSQVATAFVLCTPLVLTDWKLSKYFSATIILTRHIISCCDGALLAELWRTTRRWAQHRWRTKLITVTTASLPSNYHSRHQKQEQVENIKSICWIPWHSFVNYWREAYHVWPNSFSWLGTNESKNWEHFSPYTTLPILVKSRASLFWYELSVCGLSDRDLASSYPYSQRSVQGWLKRGNQRGDQQAIITLRLAWILIGS